ncbi:MAG: dTDP-4-dehydrorhamnose reductase, partial [Verrucomicrobiota bacterium]|nr:dTDP-4-dehydrorhamnose reductase [Verrucomicrobiota bacterium]
AGEYAVTGFNHSQLDLGSPAQLREKLDSLDFDLLINSAAQTNVDRCESEPEEAFALNAEAPRVLAEICHAKRARMIHISTDYVFDGTKTEPYTEEDAANPISVYGESKRAGEQRVLEVDGNHLVVRVSWVFGPDRPSFVDWVVEQARTKEEVSAVADKFATATYTLDLAELLQPLFDPAIPGGILHLANRGSCSWREYGQWALDCCDAEGIALRAREVGAITLADMKTFIARRPVHSVLGTGKYEKVTGKSPRDWREAVAAYVRDYLKPRTAD